MYIEPLLPIEISEFDSIRRSGAIYVDKTRALFDLCRGDRKIFLSRPRRFGKTLLVSTFESLFRHGTKDFLGLEIERLWRDTIYLVLRLDFSIARDFSTLEDFVFQLDDVFSSAFQRAGLEWKKSHAPVEAFLSFLSRQPSRSVVVLIDEYDAPLTAHLQDPVLFAKVQKVLARFYAVLKSLSGSLRFLFMTGITKFGQTSIFSAFNNLTDISLDPTYGALVGYTEEELRKYFGPYLKRAAEVLHLSDSDLLRKLRMHYDGFSFDATASTHVYAPWSVLNFLSAPGLGFANYWFRSGGQPTVLSQYLLHNELADPSSYAKEKFVSLSAFDASGTYADMDPVVLLTQTGYLTIKSVRSNGVVELGYPNQEVAVSMAQLYADRLLRNKPFVEEDGKSLKALLASGSVDDVAGYFNDVFNAMDYVNYPVTNEAMCRAYLQVLMIGTSLVPNVELHSALGRSDLEVDSGDRHWVFEIKFCRNDEDPEKKLLEGKSQVLSRRYGVSPRRRQLKFVVLFFSEKNRRFDRWVEIPPGGVCGKNPEPA